MATELSKFLISFLVVWLGSGFVVTSVERLSRTWKIPRFTVSFFILGILTSLPEISIGMSAIKNGDPSIFVGNLIGASVVLFLLVIPVLGMVGNGIHIPKSLSRRDILFILLTVATPTLLASDLKLTKADGLVMVVLYCCLFGYLFKERSLSQKLAVPFASFSMSLKWEKIIAQMMVGVVMLFFASQQIVSSTIYFANLIHISPFIVSLILVSIGTNIPEFSIIVRALIQNEKDVALADYLGSAVANTVIMGGLVLFNGHDISLPNHFWQRFIFFGLGMVVFYFFSQSKRFISRSESFILLMCYAGFLALEWWIMGLP